MRLLGRLLGDKVNEIDLEFNRRIIEALERRDPDAAEAAALEHIDEVHAIVEDLRDAVEGRSDGRRRTSRATKRRGRSA
jgi:DNA-binding FadR family transcriptional regulator